MKAASEVWKTLDGLQAEAWDRYASSITLHSSVSGQTYSPIGYNAFCGLATKVLQVDAAAAVPVEPPVGVFVADAVLVSASTYHHSIRFRASAANSDGVVTELLIQRLPNVRRKPKKQYTSAAFAGFGSPALTFDVNVEDGVYACAYRFVEAATGRQTLLQRIGVVVVGAP
jgi:hypothetical protein